MMPSLWKQVSVLLLVTVWTVNAAPTLQCDFRCSDGRCIPSSWICDNVKDCSDGKDEVNCNYLHNCKPNEFMCRSGECIPAAEKCNGVNDCSDASDEKDCQRPTAASAIDLPSAEDFEDNLKHVEVTFAPLAPITKPVLRNQARCPQRNASLYFVNNDAEVVRMRITDAPQSPELFLKKDPAVETDAILSLAFDHDQDEMLFVYKRSANRIRAFDSTANVRLFASHENESFGHIAIDPVTKNIFYAQNGAGIGVCDKDVKKCVPLITAESSETRYRNLVLHPKLGQMLWIQDDMAPILKVAGMDGEQVRVLSSFERVHAISLDADTGTLYIAEEDSVARVNLATLTRYEVANVHASALVYYNCDLYYVQRSHQSLRVLNSRGMDKEIVALTGASFPFAVVPDNFTVSQVDQCEAMDCAEVCVIAESSFGPVEPVPRCVCKTCAVELVKEDTSALSWVISVILVFLLLTLVAFFVVVYFRLWPALCDRLDELLGLNAHNTSNISVGFNTADLH